MSDNPVETLQTIRDFLRHAVSRFNAANLIYGHGTTNAYDEAAYLVLEALNLPIDQLEPYLDARLMKSERERLATLIEARVSTRKPLPYLLNKAYMHGVPFYVDERVIVPRSYIGELMALPSFIGGENAVIAEPEIIESVLDLCTGSACLAILSAMRFENATIDATGPVLRCAGSCENQCRKPRPRKPDFLASGQLVRPVEGPPLRSDPRQPALCGGSGSGGIRRGICFRAAHGTCFGQ